jgi:hypothetical protein
LFVCLFVWVSSQFCQVGGLVITHKEDLAKFGLHVGGLVKGGSNTRIPIDHERAI